MDKFKVQNWFLPFRLAQYIILSVIVGIWMGYPNFMHFQFVLYSIATLSFSILLATDFRHKLRHLTMFLIICQFVLEIVIESSIIYATGNINSQFSVLLILTIISASLVFRLIGTLLTASTVSIAYALIIWLGFGSDTLPHFTIHALQTIFAVGDSIFYPIFMHMLIFYLIAFISGYLAERLRKRDQELADASLALQKAKLETDDILKNLNSGLLSIDSSGTIIFFNKAAEKILDYKEENIKGVACAAVFSERMPELAEILMQGIKSHIAYPRKEVSVINNRKECIPVGLSTSVLTEKGNQIRGVIAIFTDLTEAKKLETKVRISDQLAAVGELSASIAHEIRNPLAAISGSVEVLKSELVVSEENAKLMSLIVKESDRLTHILNEFLIYARIDRPSYNKLELLHLISEVLEILYHHKSYHSGIHVNIESDESMVYVNGDEGLVKQLLLNLVVNACEAMGADGGELTFRLALHDSTGLVEMYVQDSGPGIEAHHLKNIYQPFYSTKKEGTGLGLSIVHRVCTALDLSIHISSQVGEGTTFMIEFKKFVPQTYSDSTSLEEYA